MSGICRSWTWTGDGCRSLARSSLLPATVVKHPAQILGKPLNGEALLMNMGDIVEMML